MHEYMYIEKKYFEKGGSSQVRRREFPGEKEFRGQMH